MKVLHISTTSSGGAGIAALRSHYALLKSGVDSRFLHIGREKASDSIYSVPNSPKSFGAICRRMHEFGYWNSIQEFVLQRRIPHGSYEAFTHAHSFYDLPSLPLVQDADVIHLHWISGLIDHGTFFKRVQKPILWTLHDMAPFLGGFHYRGDLIQNQSMNDLNARVLQQKLEGYRNAKALKIIAPSQWLLNESSKSTAFNHYSHSLVRNTLDLEKFKPHDKQQIRNLLGIPLKSKVLLFSSDDLGHKRKGLDILMGALMCLHDPHLMVCTVGLFPPSMGGIAHIHLGRISDEGLMSMIYSVVDATVITSREDNLPNVAIESFACGTPVIATPVGGLKEIIVQGKTGYLAEEITISAVQTAIQKLLDSSDTADMQENCRKFAETEFHYSSHAQALCQSYQDIYAISNSSV